MAKKSRRPLDDPRTLRRFVRKLREGIYVTSAQGEILDANPALLAILGFDSLAELQAASVHEILVDPKRRKEELELLDRDGEVREFELELRRPDGERRTALDTCYRVRDRRGGDLFHGILVDITQRKVLEAELREQSLRDGLTGCFNRHFLADFAARHAGRRTRLGAVVVDVDHFKEYNDRQGHEAGDTILRRTGRALRDAVRGEDYVIRLGGDEFLVLLVGRTAAHTEETATRLVGSAGLPVPVSIGWAARTGAEPLERTIARADHALLARRAAERRGGRRRSR